MTGQCDATGIQAEMPDFSLQAEAPLELATFSVISNQTWYPSAECVTRIKKFLQSS
jgi:hypothetical protein